MHVFGKYSKYIWLSIGVIALAMFQNCRGSSSGDGASAVIPIEPTALSIPTELNIKIYPAIEGEKAIVTAEINQALEVDVKLKWHTSDGSAHGGEAPLDNLQPTVRKLASNVPDFVHQDGELILLAGQTKASIEIQTNADNEEELSEEFFVELDSFENIDYDGDLKLNMNILDNTPRIVYLKFADVPEGSEQVVKASIKVPLLIEAKIQWVTQSNQAIEDQDFVAGSDEVVFLPGQTEAMFKVETLSDDVEETIELYNIKLTASDNLSLGEGNILSLGILDETPHIISVNTLIGIEGGQDAILNLSLKVPLLKDVVVGWKFIEKTANSGDVNEKRELSGKMLIEAGTHRAQLSLPITDDAFYEGLEYFELLLYTESQKAKLAVGSATIQIEDNNSKPAFNLILKKSNQSTQFTNNAKVSNEFDSQEENEEQYSMYFQVVFPEGTRASSLPLSYRVSRDGSISSRDFITLDDFQLFRDYTVRGIPSPARGAQGVDIPLIKPFSFKIVDDTLHEGIETFVLVVDNFVNFDYRPDYKHSIEFNIYDNDFFPPSIHHFGLEDLGQLGGPPQNEIKITVNCASHENNNLIYEVYKCENESQSSCNRAVYSRSDIRSSTVISFLQPYQALSEDHYYQAACTDMKLGFKTKSSVKKIHTLFRPPLDDDNQSNAFF